MSRPGDNRPPKGDPDKSRPPQPPTPPPTAIDAYIAEIVAAAPPISDLSAETRERLRRILSGGWVRVQERRAA